MNAKGPKATDEEIEALKRQIKVSLAVYDAEHARATRQMAEQRARHNSGKRKAGAPAPPNADPPKELLIPAYSGKPPAGGLLKVFLMIIGLIVVVGIARSFFEGPKRPSSYEIDYNRR
ncbi:hypothetical protein [Microvirga calopogonii]|uniref:hypothetical protein n=1 Tax=Microvirga calopogonii TaxID=2078013 RepID=UPI000E0DCE29|nr:hypothetical protein [Microvirga calopogonii]